MRVDDDDVCKFAALAKKIACVSGTCFARLIVDHVEVCYFDVDQKTQINGTVSMCIWID